MPDQLKPDSLTGATLIMAPDDGRKREDARVRARRRAFRIVAECELLTDELRRPEDRNWRDTFGRVLLAARRLISLTAPGPEHAPPLFDAALQPGAQLAETRAEILAALNAFAASRTAPAEARSAHRTIRELAETLFTSSDTAELDAAVRRQSSAMPQVAGERRFRVLTVDDDAQILQILQRSLQTWGLDVMTAGNGQEALAIVAANRVDLVLTDIEMPVLDGVALLQQLKSNPVTRSIPVIVISSKDDMTSVSRCIELGAEDHLAKPFAPQLLSARVKASLERKRLHDMETDALHRVAKLIEAAEAVERDTFATETLSELKAAPDGLGQLARVFDRMVSGLKSKEDRLRRRLHRLHTEVSESHDGIGPLGLISADSAFAIGDVIAGRFEIAGLLGEGGMGTVYHAHDKELGESVALKIVRREMLAQDPDKLERLKSEIRLARKISHPNVVRAHDLGEWEGRYFITMERVEGVTVADLLDRRGRLSVESTLAIGTQLCDALAVAHDASIIHRDIKPANLLIGEAGVLKVMDFGISRHLSAATGAQTKGGFVIGTPHYMAPELLLGGKPNVQTDLFAVGVVLYECLTGRLPHDGESASEIFTAIVDNQAKRVDELVDHLPPLLGNLIHQQLRFDPATRSASARELGQRLSELEHTQLA